LVLDPIETGVQSRECGADVAIDLECDAVRLVVEKEHQA